MTGKETEPKPDRQDIEDWARQLTTSALALGFSIGRTIGEQVRESLEKDGLLNDPEKAMTEGMARVLSIMSGLLKDTTKELEAGKNDTE